MKLSKVLNYLNESGYICEFLQDTTVTPIKCVNRLEKEFNIKLQKDPDFETTFSTTDLDYSDLTQSDLEKIREISRIFNMKVNVHTNRDERFNEIPGTAFVIWPVSTRNPKLAYNPSTNYNIFLHSTTIKPEIVERTGLRVKQYKDIKKGISNTELGWGGVEKGGEGRLYMSSFDLFNIGKYKTVEDRAKYIIDNMDNGYGQYHYLIKLPKNFPIRKDPEGEDDMDWVYTVNSVPSQFILYLGTEGIDPTTDEDLPKDVAVSLNDVINFIK